MPALAAACVDEQQGRAFSRRIALSLAFGEPGTGARRPPAVKRILTNLIANALTYTAEGGMVRVDVRVEEGAGWSTAAATAACGFSGRRSGAGRPRLPALRPAGHVTGAGLGLAIAMELARRMGGAMQLAGGDGHGAVMELAAAQTIEQTLLQPTLVACHAHQRV